ncbi:MAG: iron ABC transporter permease [Candidatus Rokubacteria bacterium]|nr:iron ABC transporter permease [Candidatus Rokubacteria bacterium]
MGPLDARALAPPGRRLAGTGPVARAPAAVLVVLLLTFVAWPLVLVLAGGVSDGGTATLGHLRALAGSLAVAAVSTAATVALAAALAYAVARADFPGRRLVAAAALLPMWAPPFLAALALLLLLGANGAVTGALDLAWSIEGFPGIVLAQVFTFLPQAYIVLARAMAGIDPALEEAAESLGAGRLVTLARVTLALARPGLLAASLGVFIMCMSDFGNPLLAGGGYPVLTTEIYSAVAAKRDLGAAATLSVLLLVPCLTAWVLGAEGLGWRAYFTAGADARPKAPVPSRRAEGLIVTAAVGIALSVAALYGLIPLGSVVGRWGSDWSLSGAHWGSWREIAGPVWGSVRLAVAAAIAGTVLALLAAYVIGRSPTRGARAIEVLGLLPAAMPGTVVGLGYMLAFGAGPLPALAVLVASVVFWKLPVALLGGLDALARLDPALEEAAVSLGASRGRVLARVVLPLLGPPAVSTFMYFFVSGLGTVSAVILLLPPGFSLGSVAILARVGTGDAGGACALATLLLAMVLGALLLRPALVGRERPAALSVG